MMVIVVILIVFYQILLLLCDIKTDLFYRQNERYILLRMQLQASRKSFNQQLTRSQRREFSRIRDQRSQNSRISRASLSHQRSLNSSQVRKFQYEAPTTAKRTKIARDLKQPHNRTHTEPQSRSATKLLCVGCFNHQLADARSRKKRRQQKQQKKWQQYVNSIQKYNAQHDSSRFRYEKQYDKMNQYNKNKAEIDRVRKKQQQAKERQKNQRIRYQQENQNRKRLEVQVRNNHERRQQIRRELQEQINRRRMRLAQQTEEKKQPIQPMFDQPTRDRARAIQQENYRRDLLKQINESKQKKYIEERQDQIRKQQQAESLAYDAVQRERIRRTEAERKRNLLLEDARRRKWEQQRKKQDQVRQRQQQERQRYIQMQISNQINQRKQQIQQQQVAEHVRGLKKQIQIAQMKKKQQQAYNKLPMGTIFVKRASIIKRQCDSCQKKFPPQQLTEVVEPFEV